MTVRLNASEHARIQDAAAGPGRGVSIARFVAEAALTAAGGGGAGDGVRRPSSRGAPSQLTLAELAAAVAAVNRVGNNLNQLAREQNTTGLRPVGTSETEAAVRRTLSALESLARRAAGDGP